MIKNPTQKKINDKLKRPKLKILWTDILPSPGSKIEKTSNLIFKKGGGEI